MQSAANTKQLQRSSVSHGSICRWAVGGGCTFAVCHECPSQWLEKLWVCGCYVRRPLYSSVPRARNFNPQVKLSTAGLACGEGRHHQHLQASNQGSNPTLQHSRTCLQEEGRHYQHLQASNHGSREARKGHQARRHARACMGTWSKTKVLVIKIERLQPLICSP